MLLYCQKQFSAELRSLALSEIDFEFHMGPNSVGLDKLDLALVAIYLIGITIFGLRFRSKERSLKNYFLADRNIPWWAISLSGRAWQIECGDFLQSRPRLRDSHCAES